MVRLSIEPFVGDDDLHRTRETWGCECGGGAVTYLETSERRDMDTG
jgi:hypothetical protein